MTSPVLRPLFAIYISEIFSKAITFLITPYLASALSVSHFAELEFFIAINSGILLFTSFGLDSSFSIEIQGRSVSAISRLYLKLRALKSLLLTVFASIIFLVNLSLKSQSLTLLSFSLIASSFAHIYYHLRESARFEKAFIIYSIDLKFFFQKKVILY